VNGKAVVCRHVEKNSSVFAALKKSAPKNTQGFCMDVKGKELREKGFGRP
jgi:hypothetical protein